MAKKIIYLFVSTLLISSTLPLSAWPASQAQLEFAAQLEPVNQQLISAAASHGSATVSINRDNVDYSIFANGLDPNATYQFAIHLGDRCPSIASVEDEMSSAYGPIIAVVGLTDILGSEGAGELSFHSTDPLNDLLKTISTNELLETTASGSELFENRLIVVSQLNSSQPGDSFPRLCGQLKSITSPAPPATDTTMNTPTGNASSTVQQQQQMQKIQTNVKSNVVNSSAPQPTPTWITQLLGITFEIFKSVLIAVITSWT